MSEDPSDRSQHLAGRLLDGRDHLRALRFHEAVEAITEVVDDPEFAVATDLRDVRLRATTMLAQALLGAGFLDRADARLDRVEAELEGTPEAAEGLPEVRDLRSRVAEARADRQKQSAIADRLARLADVPVEILRTRTADPSARLELLIQKANAEVEAGRPDQAVQIGEEALLLARELASVRGEVLARMSLARAAPSRAHEELNLAWSCAERANEFNLVGAVARAADLAGVDLPMLHGPTLARSELV